jgi:hypothetical protein
MNSIVDFYDSLDLRYPEIGVAMQDIDRSNPGTVKFIIPILTPNMDNTRLIDTKAYQTKDNLKNKKRNFEVETLSISNYINIKMPREVCSVYGEYTDKVIKSGSKWIIVFVGGDITKPRVIAPYIE